MKNKIAKMLGLLTVVGIVTMTGCEKKNETEGVGERSGAALDSAVESTTEAAKTTGEKVKEATGKAIEKTGEVLESAGEAVEKTGTNMQK
jgi:hypothetical protein